MGIYHKSVIGDNNVQIALNELKQASWMKVAFIVDSISTTGGQKTVVHEYPNSNVRTIESLGKFQNGYEVNAIISGNEYFNLKKRLTDKLTTSGVGEFVHPFDGAIQCYVDGNYTLVESDRNIGVATISFNLLVAEDKKTNPKANVPSTTVVANQADLADKASVANIANLTAPISSVFTAAKAKAKQVADFVNDKKEQATQAKEAISEVQRNIDEFTADIVDLINIPAQLGVSVIGLYQSVQSLYTQPIDRLDAMFQFFSFGDSDPANPPNTTDSRVRLNQFTNVLDNAANCCALSQAYRVSADVTYDSLEQIEEIQQILEEQFNYTFDEVTLNDQLTSGASQEVIDAFQDLRSSVQAFLNDAKLSAPRLVSVYTTEVPAQIIAYQYYGDSTKRQDIIDLNAITDPSYVEGDISLLTEQ